MVYGDNRVNAAMHSWRWLGMAFWDRDRAEELLKTKVLEGCTTGWLDEYSTRCVEEEARRREQIIYDEY